MKNDRNRLLSVIGMSLALLAGCAPPPGPSLTPLEIQSMQVREYEHDKAIVFASVLSVFQDLGYIVISADVETGLITTESPAKSNRVAEFLGLPIIVEDDEVHVEQTRATAFVEQIGPRSRVRLNFVATRQGSSAFGQTDRHDTPILDAAVYQNAFTRIGDAIFIRAGG